MEAISKINVINKHLPPVQTGRGSFVPRMYCFSGDRLTIITANPGSWMKVIAVENSRGEKFSINWIDIDIDYDTIPFSL